MHNLIIPLQNIEAGGLPYSRDIALAGYCRNCDAVHDFVEGTARHFCLMLMKILKEHGRIDLAVPAAAANPDFSTDYLFGPAKGQMFGVMVFQCAEGNLGALPAFSGQYNGQWLVDGWAPPLFDVRQFDALVTQTDPEIKELGRQINMLVKGAAEREQLVRRRKTLSRNLMKKIHALYRISNFRQATAPLQQVFDGNGIPAGAGDCCAPKLLNYAAVNNLRPLGIAEFFWGRENLSQTRQHGRFYPACREKCQPLLGHMLCGL